MVGEEKAVWCIATSWYSTGLVAGVHVSRSVKRIALDCRLLYSTRAPAALQQLRPHASRACGCIFATPPCRSRHRYKHSPCQRSRQDGGEQVAEHRVGIAQRLLCLRERVCVSLAFLDACDDGDDVYLQRHTCHFGSAAPPPVQQPRCVLFSKLCVMRCQSIKHGLCLHNAHA